ncbi:hypothetical protein B0H14DRAFT_3434843 [Mycena olivaceomarginata]|nr:hypothetical protein B0H14DRAFT_3434843 [Mycena olivaceomarginata]
MSRNLTQLSFSADPTQDSFALFDDEPGQQQARDGYDPAEYDAPQAGGGLLMFHDSDYMSGPVPVGPAPDRHRGSYNYSSPNLSDGGEEQQAHQQRHQSQSEQGSSRFVYCPTDDMVADILTKALPSAKVKHFPSALGLRSA